MVPEDFGSSEAGKKGGAARAKKLSKEERSVIARQGAAARWAKDLPKASHEGSIKLGNVEIPCAVLEGGQRLITQSGFMVALGRARQAKGRKHYDGDANLPAFLTAKNLKPFITKDLEVSSSQIEFLTLNGQKAFGYPAELLRLVCEVYLDAKDADKLNMHQVHVAEKAKIIHRGLAHVGIIALVDEATGYERDKERNDLARILTAFVAKELQRWLPTFDLEFYELMCDIRDLPLEKAKKRPRYFGKLTNLLVYERLAPGVLQKLREVNPVVDGRRKHKHHQHLTPDLGHPKLKEHLAGVTTVMKIAKMQDLKWDEFVKLLDKTHPKYKRLPLFDPPED